MAGRAWPFATFIAVLAVAYFTLHLALGAGAIAPDLLTVAVLLGARRASAAAGSGLGFGLGLLRDSLVVVGFGAGIVILTVLGYLGARSRDLFVGDSLFFIGLYLLVGKWIHDAIHFLLVGRTLTDATARALLLDAPLAAGYAAVAGVAAFFVYRALTGER